LNALAALPWLALAGAVWGQRAWRAASRERAFGRRFPSGPDGIVRGAEARTYPADAHRALLLIHGYNDCPASLDDIALRLRAAGWTVRLPLLPGHGRSLKVWDAWLAAEALEHVRAEYASLKATHSTVVVGGLSMGGALACWLAAEASVDGVVLFAPMLFVPRPMQVAVSTARMWGVVTKYVTGGGKRSLLDPEAQKRSISYGCSTRRSLEALEVVAKGAIPRLGFVKAPTLFCQSRDDNRLPEDQSRHAYARIGAADKTAHWVSGAGHVLTMDYGWESLGDIVREWLDARWPPRAAEQSD
jgi:carboxylesterase